MPVGAYRKLGFSNYKILWKFVSYEFNGSGLNNKLFAAIK
jgi:hypothetical protein